MRNAGGRTSSFAFAKRPIRVTNPGMALTNFSIAEESLPLPPAERVDLAQLLIESRVNDERSASEIESEPFRRLEALRTEEGNGSDFWQVLGTPARRPYSAVDSRPTCYPK